VSARPERRTVVGMRVLWLSATVYDV
jgi:hypothetical protein